MRLILLLTCLLCAVPSFAMTVKEANPAKVIIVEKNDGTVLVIQPREMDYKYILKDKTTGRSLKDILLGKKKCGLSR